MRAGDQKLMIDLEWPNSLSSPARMPFVALPPKLLSCIDMIVWKIATPSMFNMQA